MSKEIRKATKGLKEAKYIGKILVDKREAEKDLITFQGLISRTMSASRTLGLDPNVVRMIIQLRTAIMQLQAMRTQFLLTYLPTPVGAGVASVTGLLSVLVDVA